MAHAPTPTLERRHDAVRRALAERDLDGLIVSSLPNVLYLTNFTGSAAIVLLTADAVHFITDFRYITAVDSNKGTPEECPSLRLAVVSGSYDQALANVLGEFAGKRIGFEATNLTVARFDWLQARIAGGVTLVSTDDVVERSRVVKDEYEIATLREAARRLSVVAQTVIRDDVHAGLSENEVALAIDTRIRQAGFEKTSFDTIVAAGPNGALPHARPSARKLADGDLVVLDFGGVYDSYCVDLTRTVSVGRASDEARRVYGAVLEAHDRAIRAVAPGVAPWDVDSAARDCLSERGLGEAFGHGTGHGLGIEVHETPRISRRREETPDERLAAGMVFTIEPGAYLPGWGGVRIEDDVLVTGNGVEVLTTVGTKLVEV